MSSLDRIEAREREERLKAATETTWTGASCPTPSALGGQYDPIAKCAKPCATFRNLGNERIWAPRQKANRLESLLNALPLELSYEADEALKELILTSYTR